jgi:hypothetical protein
MKTRFLIPALAAMTELAVPAMAQDIYSVDRDGTVAVTGGQLTDAPSMRANTTIGDSFLRPKGTEVRVVAENDRSYITHRDYTLPDPATGRYREGFHDDYRRGSSDSYYDR